MTETFPEIDEGPLRQSAEVESLIANGAVEMWAPVIWVAPGTGETMPRVNTTTTAGNEAVCGVSVGPKLASGKAADAAGEKINVCHKGYAKCKVDHTVAIAIFDSLKTFTTAGVAAKLVPLDAPTTVTEANLQTEYDLTLGKGFAIALKASAANNDIIPVYVIGPARGGTL